MMPSATSRCNMVGSTSDTLPTKPRSTWVCAAVMRLASSPDMPTASGPCTLMAETMSRFTLPDQDHARDVERVGIGDPQAVAELGLLAETRHQLADLGASPVHHNRQHADGTHEDDVLGEGSQRVGPALAVRGVERVAAVLDDDDLAPEAADVGQGLDEHRRGVLGRRLLGPS